MLKNKFRLPKTFLPIILLIAYCLPLTATVRYVSHQGSNTPPYLTWETAADSIMSAINISVFGDTIYVANGVYKEQIIMIPGLALIGSGMDSCVIDTREFILSWISIAVKIADSCLLKGFNIIVSYNITLGMGVAGTGDENSLVTQNKITNARFGIFLDATFFDTADITVYKNVCNNVGIGIEMFNSNSLISSNFISTPTNSTDGIGIHIGAFDYSYKPIIDSNYIELEGRSFSIADGINISFGTRPTISNNIIILKGSQNSGIRLGSSDSGKVYNNLIFAESGQEGINNLGIQYLQLFNNYIGGKFESQPSGFYTLAVGPDNIVKNNVVTGGGKGVRAWGTENLVFQYNNVWNNDINYLDFTPDTTNLSVDPMIVNEDTTQGELDFHLQMYSQLIDAGDPNILDVNGSRSDIGLYGGLFGESYTYQDLPPRPPRNLFAVVDSEYISLSWNGNTEADFRRYTLYKDTTSNFTPDSTTFIANLADTFYVQVIPGGNDAIYYKLTATDNQGNESRPSEELAVLITSVNEYPSTVSNYQLYQNYPNPFNPSTKIGYKLKERGYVKLMVYDIKGELVSMLVNQVQETGYYEVEFFGKVGSRQSAGGNRHSGSLRNLASGIYIYQIMVKSERNIPVFSDIKKMIYIK